MKSKVHAYRFTGTIQQNATDLLDFLSDRQAFAAGTTGQERRRVVYCAQHQLNRKALDGYAEHSDKKREMDC